MTLEEAIQYLKLEKKQIFVALPQEVAQENVNSPIIYTGVGKLAAAQAVYQWIMNTPAKERNLTTIVNVGTAGSSKYNFGEMKVVDTFINGGSELVRDIIEFGDSGVSVYTSDFFVSKETMPPALVDEIHSHYDFFDMEAYSIARAAKSVGLKVISVKIVSDGLNGTLKDWEEVLATLRPDLENFINSISVK